MCVCGNYDARRQNFLAGDNPSKLKDCYFSFIFFPPCFFWPLEAASWSVSGSDLTAQGADEDIEEEEEVNLAPDGGK